MEQAEKRVPMNGIDYPDKETFERIWQRVMPDQSLSPVVVAQDTTPVIHNHVTTAEPVQQGEVLEAEDDVQILEQMLGEMMLQWHHLQYISKKSTGGMMRALIALTEREDKQIRKLTALYFLMTGVVPNYPSQGISRSETLTTLLRRFFLQEEQWHRTLHHLSEQWDDSCFYEVFIELSQGTEAQCRGICGLLANFTSRSK